MPVVPCSVGCRTEARPTTLYDDWTRPKFGLARRAGAGIQNSGVRWGTRHTPLPSRSRQCSPIRDPSPAFGIGNPATIAERSSCNRQYAGRGCFCRSWSLPPWWRPVGCRRVPRMQPTAVRPHVSMTTPSGSSSRLPTFPTTATRPPRSRRGFGPWLTIPESCLFPDPIPDCCIGTPTRSKPPAWKTWPRTGIRPYWLTPWPGTGSSTGFSIGRQALEVQACCCREGGMHSQSMPGIGRESCRSPSCSPSRTTGLSRPTRMESPWKTPGAGPSPPVTSHISCGFGMPEPKKTNRWARAGSSAPAIRARGGTVGCR